MSQAALFLHGASDIYGSGRVLLDAVQAMFVRGYSCYVFLPEVGPLQEEFVRLGASVHILELGVLRRKYNNPFGLANRLVSLVCAIVKLSVFVRARSIEIVYSNTTAIVAGAVVAKIMRVKHIWHIHEIIAKPHWLAFAIAWAINNMSDLSIVVSGPVKEHFDAIYKRNPSRLRVIHNGIDTEKFQNDRSDSLRASLGFGADHLVIGMIGRVHYWKGQDYFLRIARCIHDKYPNSRFVMVGNAYPGYEYLYTQLSELRAQLHLDAVVLDLGYREDIPQVLSIFDIFVLPSTLPDPMPLVLLEAMSASKPVVATAHGGALEMVVDGETGFLVPWDDALKVRDNIEPILESAEKRKAMGAKALEHVRASFSLQLFQEQIVFAVDRVATVKR